MSTDKSRQPVTYVISAVERFVDEEIVKRYAALAGSAIERYEGRFIVSAGVPVVVEGQSSTRYLSMVEFPSMERANAWYDSSENIEARAISPRAFKGRVLMFVQSD